MIKIKTTPFQTIQYYYGVYTEKTQWQDELDITDFPFTIKATHKGIDGISTSEEISWLKAAPINMNEVESKILEEYLSVGCK